jgi:hypothetical protein
MLTQARPMLLLALLVASPLVAIPAVAQAEKLLAAPPAKGELHPGERVLVDDHTCPPSQIKEIIGGSNIHARGSIAATGAMRQTRCIPH